ncbi:MAG: hypothetical protein C5B55_13160 [Blastocatellia bacterium]|nr:MAG: hypothetical protein C5B55_13160 [Blastocatellia bacterium]
MPGFFSKLVSPWYPPVAIGLEKGSASVVHLERVRGGDCAIRRAATFSLSETLISPGFDNQNIERPSQLASVLNELVATAGLIRQKRWSVSLPAATTRTLVLTIETPAQSGSELQEILTWKMERGFGVPLDELSITQDQLQKDSQGRARYLSIGVRKTVLAEYENLFSQMGWRVGLILPRHVGEAQWLVRSNGNSGDSLLLSSSLDGFTAIIFRDKYPLILRSVSCAVSECEDELYRLLMFYRDRRTTDQPENTLGLSRLMVVGDGLSPQRASEIVNETTGGDLRPLHAADLGLNLPSRDLSFDVLAAPAGLATLSL